MQSTDQVIEERGAHAYLNLITRLLLRLHWSSMLLAPAVIGILADERISLNGEEMQLGALLLFLADIKTDGLELDPMGGKPAKARKRLKAAAEQLFGMWEQRVDLPPSNDNGRWCEVRRAIIILSSVYYSRTLLGSSVHSLLSSTLAVNDSICKPAAHNCVVRVAGARTRPEFGNNVYMMDIRCQVLTKPSPTRVHFAKAATGI